jgi:hypothetical protein
LINLTTPHIMKYLLCICLAVGVSLDAFAAGSPDDAKAVQGSWKPVRAELAGQPMTDAVPKSLKARDHPLHALLAAAVESSCQTDRGGIDENNRAIGAGRYWPQDRPGHEVRGGFDDVRAARLANDGELHAAIGESGERAQLRT